MTHDDGPDILKGTKFLIPKIPGAHMLHIKLQDVRRATLPVRSGNEGWIGVSPRGDDYHVVVPVDRQIARGVMACNSPTDGTPFGGYSRWLYFRCPTYEDCGAEENALRDTRARETALALLSWLASYEIEACLDPEDSSADPGCGRLPEHPDTAAGSGPIGSETNSEGSRSGKPIRCSLCDKQWGRIVEFLRDSQVRAQGYRACVEDFTSGRYLFSHSCGNTMEIPVSKLARASHRGRSLIGTHACPGFCYYEKSLLSCSAECEGASYRRIAEKLRRRLRVENV